GLDEAHHRHPLHAVEHDGARGLEPGAAERFEGGIREPPPQRRDHRRSVRVARRLARRDVDARPLPPPPPPPPPRPPPRGHRPPGAGGAASAAPATRKAGARAWGPAAPRPANPPPPRPGRGERSR